MINTDSRLRPLAAKASACGRVQLYLKFISAYQHKGIHVTGLSNAEARYLTNEFVSGLNTEANKYMYITACTDIHALRQAWRSDR